MERLTNMHRISNLGWCQICLPSSCPASDWGRHLCRSNSMTLFAPEQRLEELHRNGQLLSDFPMCLMWRTVTLSATSRNRCWDLLSTCMIPSYRDKLFEFRWMGADRLRSHALRTKLWSRVPSRRVQAHTEEQEVWRASVVLSSPLV